MTNQKERGVINFSGKHLNLSKFKIGDKVVATSKAGYALLEGVVAEIVHRKYGVSYHIDAPGLIQMADYISENQLILDDNTDQGPSEGVLQNLPDSAQPGTEALG